MLVSIISPPNLSLIGPLTAQIYYWTGKKKTGNAQIHRLKHTHPIYRIKGLANM